MSSIFSFFGGGGGGDKSNLQQGIAPEALHQAPPGYHVYHQNPPQPIQQHIYHHHHPQPIATPPPPPVHPSYQPAYTDYPGVGYSNYYSGPQHYRSDTSESSLGTKIGFALVAALVATSTLGLLYWYKKKESKEEDKKSKEDFLIDIGDYKWCPRTNRLLQVVPQQGSQPLTTFSHSIDGSLANTSLHNPLLVGEIEKVLSQQLSSKTEDRELLLQAVKENQTNVIRDIIYKVLQESNDTREMERRSPRVSNAPSIHLSEINSSRRERVSTPVRSKGLDSSKDGSEMYLSSGLSVSQSSYGSVSPQTTDNFSYHAKTLDTSISTINSTRVPRLNLKESHGATNETQFLSDLSSGDGSNSSGDLDAKEDNIHWLEEELYSDHFPTSARTDSFALSRTRKLSRSTIGSRSPPKRRIETLRSARLAKKSPISSPISPLSPQSPQKGVRSRMLSEERQASRRLFDSQSRSRKDSITNNNEIQSLILSSLNFGTESLEQSYISIKESGNYPLVFKGDGFSELDNAVYILIEGGVLRIRSFLLVNAITIDAYKSKNPYSRRGDTIYFHDLGIEIACGTKRFIDGEKEVVRIGTNIYEAEYNDRKLAIWIQTNSVIMSTSIEKEIISDLVSSFKSSFRKEKRE